MRNIFTLTLFFIVFNGHAQDGQIDPGFGTSGKQVTGLSGPVFPDLQQVAVLPGGKILQAFSVQNSVTGNYDFGLARFDKDGNLDITFDGDGIVMTDFGGDDVATSLTVRPDGKIVLAGYTSPVGGGNRQFAVARYNSDGTLDNSFDTDGKVTTAIGTDDAALAVIQMGGKTYVAGSAFTGSHYDFAVVVYNDNGSLDGTWDTDGKVTTSIGGQVDQAYDLNFTPDGKLVVAGYSFNGSNYLFAVTKYNADGSLDNTFDGDSGTGNGIVTKSINTGIGGNDIAYDMVVQPDGKILLGGTTNLSGTNDFAMVRFNPDGTLDTGFDGDSGTGNGVVVTAIGSSADQAYSVALQSDGKILLAGSTAVFNGTADENNFAIVRYNTNGTIDLSFGSSGITTIDFGGDDFGYSIASQGTNIIFAGRSGTNLAMTRLINSTSILPVQLMTFTGTKQNASVVLNWQTASEQNTSYFEVQRSNDGQNFITLSQVRASGNSNSAKDYSFTDVKPRPVNFYRLRIVNTNGTSSLTRVLMIRFADLVHMEVFPNPARNSVTIQVTQPSGVVAVQVTDISGRLVKQMQLRSSGTTLSASLDISSLPGGMYFIRVNDETMKIIKE